MNERHHATADMNEVLMEILDAIMLHNVAHVLSPTIEDDVQVKYIGCKKIA